MRLPLKLPRLPVTGNAHTHGVVPASRGHGAALRGAVVTHALPAGAAVVLGQLGAELALTAVAAQDVLVRHPVGGPRCVLHQTWGESAGPRPCRHGGTRLEICIVVVMCSVTVPRVAVSPPEITSPCAVLVYRL